MTNPREKRVRSILEDGRPIRWLSFPNGTVYKVGTSGVTKIVAYGEPGEYCLLPWFAIYKGDTIMCRVNAAAIETLEHIEKEGESK